MPQVLTALAVSIGLVLGAFGIRSDAVATAPAVGVQPASPSKATGAGAAAEHAPAVLLGTAHPSNRLSLESDPAAFDVSVGSYSDCTHRGEVGRGGGYIDECLHHVSWYFIGHNPGPFTPLASGVVGQVVDYRDGAGKLHRFQVVSDRTWNRYWGAPPAVQADVRAQFQTCLTVDGTWDHILDAVELAAGPDGVSAPLGGLRTA